LYGNAAVGSTIREEELLITNGELTFHKTVECTQMTGLVNRGKGFQMPSFKWENDTR